MTCPAGWKRVALAEFVVLQRGLDLPRRKRLPGPYPVLSSGEASGWHSEGPVKGPGFVVGRATNIGRPTWSDADYWPLNTVLYAKDFRGNDARFAFYWFLSTDLTAYNSGSVQPMLNRNYIANVPVDVPPPFEQRRIAATLGALDDKLESNRRAINLIQALSQAIYNRWRDLHRDGLETTFGDFADVFGGATPKTSEPDYWGGDISWATPTDITALFAPYLFRTSRTITDEGLASTSASLHPEGTILLTSRATIGSFAVTQTPATTNQGFIAVRPRKPEHRWFLFEEMRARVPEMLDRANGSTFMELSRGNFKLMPIGVPDEAAIDGLDAVLRPLHAKAAQLHRESSRVAKLRDTLLPELLSGRIRVPEAREVVEEAAG